MSGTESSKNANQTYGIMYDPTTDSVKLGLGTIDETGKFTFSENGNPVAVRADSSLLVDGHLIKWDATNNRFVDSGKSVDDMEDLANKVAQITEENKASEVAYPSVKAMTDYVNSVVGAIDTWLQNIYAGEGV